MARSPRLLLDESKSRVMQVARGRRDVFLLAYEQYIRMGREGRGGEVSPPPAPRPPPTFPRGGGIGRGGSNMDACEPHATPFVSVLWLLDRSASYFTVSTFRFLHESSRVASRMAALPGSRQHTFSPAFATCRIYSGGPQQR